MQILERGDMPMSIPSDGGAGKGAAFFLPKWPCSSTVPTS